jgi:hypothetical protein
MKRGTRSFGLLLIAPTCSQPNYFGLHIFFVSQTKTEMVSHIRESWYVNECKVPIGHSH